MKLSSASGRLSHRSTSNPGATAKSAQYSATLDNPAISRRGAMWGDLLEPAFDRVALVK